MKKIIIIIFVVFSVCFSSIKIFTNKTEAYTGERLKISIDLERPVNSHPDLSSLHKSFSEDFELIGSDIIEQKNESGIIYEKIVNEYAVFAKPGEHFFGPLSFSYVVGKDEKAFTSDSIRVMVKSVTKDRFVTVVDSTGAEKKMPLDSLNMVLPIKDIGTYELSLREKWYIGIFLFLMATVVFLIIFLSKRKRKTKDEEIIVKKKLIPAHIKAIEKLNELKEKKYLSKGEFKEFASELSLIFRNFLEDRFEFPGAELPTEELKEEIRNRISDKDTLSETDKLLEVTDFVKYAKFIPLETELKSFLEFAYQAVDKLKEESKNGVK